MYSVYFLDLAEDLVLPLPGDLEERAEDFLDLLSLLLVFVSFVLVPTGVFGFHLGGSPGQR